MQLIKFIWAARAIVYRISFGKVGKLSYIGKPIFLQGTRNVFIYNRVRIYPGVRFETYGSTGRITIEDNVSIGQNFHATSMGSNLIIGRNSTIAGNVFITNIDHNYREIGKHIMNQEFLVSETVLGENCFIGFGAAMQAGTKLGKHCVVGANSVVRGVYPDYCVIAGVPAKIIRRYNPETQQWERETEARKDNAQKH